MRFSLIIPVAPYRNAEIIESIKELDYPRSDFQVLVVKGTNPSENRNNGAIKSKGEILGFLDDDAVLDTKILNKAKEFFDKYPEIDIVGGPQLTPKDDKTFARISGYSFSSLFGAWKMSNRYIGNEKKLDVDETMLTSANMFVRSHVMDKIKFDPKLWPGEDPKFIEDAKKEGFKVAYDPEIIIYHRRRPNLKSLMIQIYKYGVVRPKKESFFETIKRPFFLIPSLFFLYLLFLLGIILFNPSITGAVIGKNRNLFFVFLIPSLFFLYLLFLLGIILFNPSITGAVIGKNRNLFFEIIFLPLFVYIFLNIIFSIKESVKNKELKAFFLLLLIFPLIHLSYGYGMIVGYFKKVF